MKRGVTAETKQHAIADGALAKQANWDAMEPPWKRAKPAGTDTPDGGNARLTSGELAMLPCEASDTPALKLVRFKSEISTVKSMKAAQLKAMLPSIPHASPYSNADDAKVQCLQYLQTVYAAEPDVCRDGSPVEMDWKIRRSWVPANLKPLMFPSGCPKGLTHDDEDEDGSDDEDEDEVVKQLGWGAATCAAPALLLANPAPVLAPAIAPVLALTYEAPTTRAHSR